MENKSKKLFIATVLVILIIAAFDRKIGFFWSNFRFPSLSVPGLPQTATPSSSPSVDGSKLRIVTEESLVIDLVKKFYYFVRRFSGY